MNNKFEKVSNALTEKSSNLRLSKKTNATHKYKYTIEDIRTHQISKMSYRTLNDVIDDWELTI